MVAGLVAAVDNPPDLASEVLDAVLARVAANCACASVTGWYHE